MGALPPCTQSPQALQGAPCVNPDLLAMYGGGTTSTFPHLRPLSDCSNSRHLPRALANALSRTFDVPLHSWAHEHQQEHVRRDKNEIPPSTVENMGPGGDGGSTVKNIGTTGPNQT